MASCTTTTTTTDTMTTPWTIGTSVVRTELTASEPSPFMAKTCSTISDPPSSAVTWKPSTVTTGTSAFGSA